MSPSGARREAIARAFREAAPRLVEVVAARREPAGGHEDAGVHEGPGRALLDHRERFPDELFAFLLLPLEVAEEEAEPGERQCLRRPARVRPRADREGLAERLLGALAVLERQKSVRASERRTRARSRSSLRRTLASLAASHSTFASA